MKRFLLAAVLACGMGGTTVAQDTAVPDAGDAASETQPEDPAPMEASIKGKLVSEVRKSEDGAEYTVYAIETADGKKMALPRREGMLPAGVDLAAMAGRVVTVRAKMVTRMRGSRKMPHIQRVLSIEAAAE